MGNLKRRENLGGQGQRLHELWSKSTIHKALLVTWMEINGKDCHPDDMTDEDWADYKDHVERCSSIRRKV